MDNLGHLDFDHPVIINIVVHLLWLERVLRAFAI